MIVLVTGGRGYRGRWVLEAVLDGHDTRTGITRVVHGDARGADTFAREWAEKRGIEHQAFPADWANHGRAAGPIRNGIMLRDGKPDLVIAFPGGKGTADMVSRARRAGIPIDDRTKREH